MDESVATFPRTYLSLFSNYIHTEWNILAPNNLSEISQDQQEFMLSDYNEDTEEDDNMGIQSFLCGSTDILCRNPCRQVVSVEGTHCKTRHKNNIKKKLVSDSERCRGRTRENKRCKNKKQQPNEYCAVHNPSATPYRHSVFVLQLKFKLKWEHLGYRKGFVPNKTWMTNFKYCLANSRYYAQRDQPGSNYVYHQKSNNMCMNMGRTKHADAVSRIRQQSKTVIIAHQMKTPFNELHERLAHMIANADEKTRLIRYVYKTPHTNEKVYLSFFYGNKKILVKDAVYRRIMNGEDIPGFPKLDLKLIRAKKMTKPMIADTRTKAKIKRKAQRARPHEEEWFLVSTQKAILIQKAVGKALVEWKRSCME